MSQSLLRLLHLTLTVALYAQEKTAAPFPCQDLPSAVKTAAAKQGVPALSQASCEKIRKAGATLYEVKVTPAPGKMREIVFRPNGELVEFEEESELAAIPPAAQAAILKAVGAGELAKVDIIRRGSTVLYEGEYRMNGAKKKAIVDAAGRPVTD